MNLMLLMIWRHRKKKREQNRQFLDEIARLSEDISSSSSSWSNYIEVDYDNMMENLNKYVDIYRRNKASLDDDYAELKRENEELKLRNSQLSDIINTHLNIEDETVSSRIFTQRYEDISGSDRLLSDATIQRLHQQYCQKMDAGLYYAPYIPSF